MKKPLDYQVLETVFDGKSMLDEQNFYHQNQGEPAKLTKQLTYILGDSTQNYPICTMTSSLLASKGASQEISDTQFTYTVVGRDEKASVIASTLFTEGDTPGKGNSKFTITFSDNWIKRYYVIQSSTGVQLYVHSKGKPSAQGEGFDYEVQVASGNPEEWCPVSELQGGTRWIDLYAAVAESESRGTESRMVAPGSYKNQLGYIRKSASWAGTSASRVMNIEVNTDKGQKTSAWMDFFMWQFEKAWMHEKETHYWYSRYNRLESGAIGLKDAVTGKDIPMGSGLLEQIQNKGTYSKLTYNYLMNTISDALFGQSDTDNMSITLFTGTGGIREFHNAMKEEGISLLGGLGNGNISDRYVTGQGRELMLGGFFYGFYHIDGYTIKVKKNPLFDRGKVAMASPLHPKSGLPLESYRMVFIDDANYDGQANLRSVYHSGFKSNYGYNHGIVQGLNEPPKSLQMLGAKPLGAGDLRDMATDVDVSSYHRHASCGVQLLRGNKCFDLQCVAGI